MPDELKQRAERLQSYIHLLREAWSHAAGANQLHPDPALTAFLGRIAELESRAGVDLVDLGIAPPAAHATPASPPTADQIARMVSEAQRAGYELGFDAADEAGDVSYIAVCDVRGTLAVGETLRVGPLDIFCGGRLPSTVRLRGRSEIQIGQFPSGLLAFRARTSGRDYPEVIRADDGGDDAKADGPDAPKSAEQPLAIVGQGSGARALMPGDV